MFDANANAAAIKRVNNKRKERIRRAYDRLLSTPEGRAFIHDLCETCHLYTESRGLVDEGKRQIALGVRQQAIELGYFDQWQLAEREAEEFKQELRRMLEQTEAREDEGF